ncbi:MAG: LuxR C-terminal-related transcriptional regulator [Chloroflexi bacterium]|nr:LuxR C-terminal-related transcriptional regulator [Chloroflexota bacterium]
MAFVVRPAPLHTSMDDISRETIGDILYSALERMRRARAYMDPTSPAARELSVAQRLVEAAVQSLGGELPAGPASPDGDAVHSYANAPDLLPLPPLTLREEEVLRLMSNGLRNKEIAARLGISERTATFHVGNVLSKLGADGRVEAIRIARQRGLI